MRHQLFDRVRSGTNYPGKLFFFDAPALRREVHKIVSELSVQPLDVFLLALGQH